MALSTRREGVVPVGIALPNATVPSVNEYFAALISGMFPSGLDRFLLGFEVARNLFSARLTNRPFLPARHNMLTFRCHW